MRQRAIAWYTKALAGGQVTGLGRMVVEKRIATAPLSATQSQTIDLLTLFDPKDAVAGTWSLDKSASRPVLVNQEGEFCRFQFPYRPPDEYDFRVTFTYTTKGGPIILMCPLSDGSIMWYTEFNKTAFESRGKRVVVGTGPYITRGKEHSSLVKVRKDKVQGYLDDRLVCEFNRNDQSAPAISSSWVLPDSTAVGVGVWASNTTFTRVELIEVSGSGKRLR